MQMAKTAAALTALAKAKLPFISVLTDPTMGGVSASFAMIGDVVIAEPGALIGFAGPRVIEQTVRETLPEGFQRAEFLLQHGAIDMIVDRRQMRDRLASLLTMLSRQPAVAPGSSCCRLPGTPGPGCLDSPTMSAANPPGELASLADWLAYLQQLHPKTIAMGLDRVTRVQDALALRPAFPVVTVGGTNGKGSTCAMLEAILHAAGYRVGLYTSPHLLRYNERVRIGRIPATDAELCRAFAEVERARGDTPLTYFEFGTLAAMIVFLRAQLDARHPRGGARWAPRCRQRFDADVAIVTSVDMDHMEYLGDTREAIGFEKAGIFRAGRAGGGGEPDCPQTVIDHAAAVGARLLLVNRDFDFSGDGTQWRYWGPRGRRGGLPYPALRGEHQLFNASAVHHRTRRAARPPSRDHARCPARPAGGRQSPDASRCCRAVRRSSWTWRTTRTRP